MDAKPANISELFLGKGIVNLAQLRAAQDVQRRAGGEIGDIIVQLGFTTEEQVARCRAVLYDLPYVDLGHVVMDTQLLQAVSKIYLFKFAALPIERRGDGKLLLVVANPNVAVPICRRFEEALGVDTALGISTKTAIVDRLTRLFGTGLSLG